MNNLETTIAALSDEDLKDAIRNLKAFDESDVPAQGVFRRVAESVVASGRTEEDAIGFSRYALLRAAAYRWACPSDK
jgi:hypothetical protein